MKNIITIFRRELRAFFNSPIAYIFIIVFLLITNGLFMSQFFLYGRADMRPLFYLLPVVLCAFIPALTMRSWAEDKRGNTFELLLTFPMRAYELVAGKFLASLAFYMIALFSTFTIPVMLSVLGKPDMGVIISQYIGAVCMGIFFLALGIFISGFCRDQIIAFILTMTACFGLYFLGFDFTAASIDGWIPHLGTFIRNTIGTAQHVYSFEKGVIDNRDLVYYFVGAVIFLILNSFWLDSRLRPKAKAIFTSAAVISVSIFSISNLIFADIPVGRFDLTEGKIYTLSKASKDILRGLKAPVLVKYYVSPVDKMPADLKTLERDVRDKLQEFKINSKGKFDYKVFYLDASNVSRNVEESLEKSIEKKGIRPFEVSNIEADEVGVKLIYSSVAIAYKEKSEDVLPQIVPGMLPALEYMIISKVYRMTLDTQPKLALMAPYKEKALDPQIAALLSQIGQLESSMMREDKYEMITKLLRYEGYDIARIRLTREEEIPAGTKTLLILEPENLNDRQRYEINKFLAGGGSVFMAVQKFDFNYTPQGNAGVSVDALDKNPGVGQLSDKWGIGVSGNFLMDEQCDIITFQGGNILGIIPVSVPIKLPMQIKVVASQMNQDVSITSRLDSIFYVWGNALVLDDAKLKESGLKTTILFSSSKDSWEAPYHDGPLTKSDMEMPKGKGARKAFPLAALAEGQFPDVFKGQPVPDWPVNPNAPPPQEAEKPKEINAINTAPGKLIMVGCSAIFRKELFNVQGHINFLLNSVDVLSLGDKLINVRNKAEINRTIKRLSAPVKAAWRIAAVFLIPVIFCAAGSIRFIVRRRSKWMYLKTIE